VYGCLGGSVFQEVKEGLLWIVSVEMVDTLH
jgi:hypothetical protein